MQLKKKNFEKQYKILKKKKNKDFNILTDYNTYTYKSTSLSSTSFIYYQF